MPQNSNYDPQTGQWHADPMWRRYDPRFQTKEPFPNPLKGLKNLFAKLGPEEPEPPSFTVPPSPGNESIDLNSLITERPQEPSRYEDQFAPTSVDDQAITGLQAARPNNYDPAEAASTLGGGQMSANLPGELNSLRENRLIEMMRNRELAAGSGGMMGAGATGTDIGALSSLMQTDPSTGQAQRERLADIQRRSDEAALGGFGSPQAAARSAQAMEQSKIDVPVRAQEAQAKGNVEVAKINQKPYADFLNMIKGGQGQTGLGPGDTLSIGGLGSFHRGSDGNVPTQIYRDVAVALQNMLRSGETDFFGQPTDAKKVFDQTIRTAIASSDLDPELQELVVEVMGRADLRDKPLEELIDTESIEPDRLQKLANVMMLIRQR